MDYEFEDLNDEDSDVMIRMRHDDGTTVTFLTAPAEVFTDKTQLEPLVFGISEMNIYVAFNSDVIESMIEESVEKNGETYGAQAASFLPITMILNKGLKAVEKYKTSNKPGNLNSFTNTDQIPNTDNEKKAK